MFIQKKTKRVMAGDEVMEPNMEGEVVEDVVDGEGEVVVDPEATDLLFEAEDVAELVAEITGEAVEVSVTDDAVEFAIGEDVYTVEAEGNEEILEAASKKVLRGKRTVAASTKRQAPARRKPAAKPVAASTQARASRPVRKVPTRK
ncbi:MAG: hypothetical protein J6I97_08325 [Agathobacter sp.]|nr:hypothetical protein [Agathobacter sp.]